MFTGILFCGTALVGYGIALMCIQRPEDSPDESRDDMNDLEHIDDLIMSVMRWHCPSEFGLMLCPYPGTGMVGVLLKYREVLCEVPVCCICCAHKRLDCTVQQLVRQADPDPFRDQLKLAGAQFEQAIGEISK